MQDAQIEAYLALSRNEAEAAINHLQPEKETRTAISRERKALEYARLAYKGMKLGNDAPPIADLLEQAENNLARGQNAELILEAVKKMGEVHKKNAQYDTKRILTSP